MPRVKRGSKRRKRRAKILKLAKGYWGTRSTNYRTAKEAVEKSLLYAYRDRKTRKRDFRRQRKPRRRFRPRLHRLHQTL